MSWTGELGSGPSRSKRFGRQSNLDKLVRMPWGLVAMIMGLAIFGTAMLYSSTITNPDVADLPAKHFSRFAMSFVLMMGLNVGYS